MLHVITVTEAVQLPGPLLQSEENRINMERKVDRSRKSKWYHSWCIACVIVQTLPLAPHMFWLAWITTKFLVFFFFLDAVSVFLQVFPPERNKSEGLSVKWRLVEQGCGNSSIKGKLLLISPLIRSQEIITDAIWGLLMLLAFFTCAESIGALHSLPIELMVNAMGPWEVLLVNRN